MMQTPVNYLPVQQTQPASYQPSYNAVKIDIHNPKVTDGCSCPSAYNMPNAPYYNYPQAQIPAGYYPYWMPQQPVQYPVQQPVQCPVQQPVQQPIQQPVQQPVQPVAQQPVQTIAQQPAQPVVPEQVPVVPLPVPQVPVQQVINNGVPAQQTIQQTPVAQPAQTVQQPQPVNVPVQPVEIQTPAPKMPMTDITPVLKGLQSNNLAEQSVALNKIGEAAENPKEIEKYLETSVMDALLNILNTNTDGLEPATQAQIDARTKLVNNQQVTDNERNLAMTLSPKEVAEENKQHALYSIAILQKALAKAVEEKTGEKLTIEKLPAIDQVVNVIKSNPSPLLRSSAIVALAHLDNPEYKPVLNSIFTLAQNDQDPNVKQVATEALNKINGNQTQK